VRSIIICTHLQISLGRSSQGECGEQSKWNAWEKREECTRFWWESPRNRAHSEDQGLGGRIVSEWILGRLAGGFEWTRLAQDRDWWRDVVNAVMNLRVLAPGS
jgi:hypothetical protein